MLSKIAVQRLSALIKFMDKLPRSAAKHFNMGSWFNHDGPHDLKVKNNRIERRHLNDCGTTACALGWAATMPAFRKAGLRFVFDNEGWGADILYRRANGIEAAMKFFQVERDVAAAFFGCGSEEWACADARTPKQWARLARKVLKQYQQPEV